MVQLSSVNHYATLGGQGVERSKLRLGIIAANFNAPIIELLLKGAEAAITESGVPPEQILYAQVPGAFELGFAARRLIKRRQHQLHALIAFGCVIRGETSHYDYVCAESARGIQDAAADTGVPVIFGVLTTENVEQAMVRADPEQKNKGGQAVWDAIQMADFNANTVRAMRPPASSRPAE